MKNIKNILGMGAFMLLASLAVSSCTEKSDWDIDSSYSRPFGTDENGISVETDSKVARAVVTWSSTSNTDYYIIEISPNEMTDETPMGSEENGNIVYGNDPANRIKQSPYTMDNLAVNTTYYMRIKSISGEKESRWVNYKKTFASVKEEAILNIPTTEDLPEGQGKVRMSWEAGLAVDHFEIMETGATEATSRVISSTEAAAGEAWVENLKSFTEYTITIYNENNPRGSQTVTIPGLEIESTISDITANSAVFSWEETVDVDEYACVLSTEGVPESGTQLSPADIAAHKVTITGLASSTEYTAYAFANGSICSRITFTTKKGLQGGHYGILHASDITGSSGAGSLASLKLNLTNSTIANFIGAASSIVRTANTQQNVTTNIENCTFYGLTTSGEQLMRDITGATCTFNVSNTLFAASNTNYKVFNSATVAPSNVSWQKVYATSDFKFTNTTSSTTYDTMTLSSSELFSCTDSNSEFTLTYGNNVSEEYKVIGDQRWNK